jgi:RND family efflux transporter MFP subunit
MNKSITVTVILSFLLFASGCKAPSSPPETAPSNVSGLKTALVQQASIPVGTRSTGTVHAKEDSVLSVQTMGRVTSVLVHEGDAVRAGQTLLTLDNAQAVSDVARATASVATYEQELKVAESDADLAASTLHRYELLRDRKSVSSQEFDEVARRAQAAKARVDAAQAQITAARASVSGANTSANYAHLTAPFAGYVTARHVDPGAMAMPGTPLLEVERAGTLQLQIAVDESLVQGLQRGMSVEVTVSSLSTAGNIAEIDPAGDPTSHSFVVKIDLPANPAIRSGMYGTAFLARGTHVVILVLKAAIVTHGSLNTVWVVGSDGIAGLRYVTLGESHNDSIEALSGLSGGERVVLAPQDRELGGRKIEVQP